MINALTVVVNSMVSAQRYFWGLGSDYGVVEDALGFSFLVAQQCHSVAGSVSMLKRLLLSARDRTSLLTVSQWQSIQSEYPGFDNFHPPLVMTVMQQGECRVLVMLRDRQSRSFDSEDINIVKFIIHHLEAAFELNLKQFLKVGWLRTKCQRVVLDAGLSVIAKTPHFDDYLQRLFPKSSLAVGLQKLCESLARGDTIPGYVLQDGHAYQYRIIDIFESDAAIEALTEKEICVCRMIIAALETAEIASALGIQGKTVDAHVKNIKNKLGVATRSGIIKYLHCSGYEFD